MYHREVNGESSSKASIIRDSEVVSGEHLSYAGILEDLATRRIRHCETYETDVASGTILVDKKFRMACKKSRAPKTVVGFFLVNLQKWVGTALYTWLGMRRRG